MARGSPDHTDRTELQYMHYTDRVVYSPMILMTVWPAWTNIINEDIEGVFGRIRIGSDDPFLYLRITIDGVIVFDMHAANIYTIDNYGVNAGFNKVVCTRYDAISDHYDFVYDEEWGLWIKENITVELTYEVAHAGDGSYHLFYKEKEL